MMKKVGKKITSILVCALMVLSCLNITVFTELGALIASATNVTTMAGDINGDGAVNNKDLTRLLKYIAGEDVSVISQTLDTNGDGIVNNKDLTRLLKYIAGENVELAPVGCNHSMTKTEAKDATCTEEGNIVYWFCSVCGGYFSDKSGITETTLEETIIEAKGHSPVVDPAIAPTYDSAGLTAGSHCSTCNTVLQAQEEVPMLQKTEYAITYDLYNGDTYLQSIGVTNNNPSVYASEDGLQLKNLKATGYKFLGWYDLPAGSNAEIVKSIPAGTKGEIELYAHWEKEVYEVEFEFPTQFNADLVSLDKVTYTVDKGVVLPTPQLEGYIFAGWSDNEGNIIKKIPVGTTGAKQYMANWLSKRNQAWTKQKLDDPIIIEDMDSNVILFTYEIGEIRNVPVYEIENFGYINANGISKTVTKTFSTTVSESLMEQYTNTVENSTVNSYGWTLSNGWTEGTTIDEEWCEEHGMTTEEAESYCKSDTDGWYVSKGSSGSETTETLDTTETHKFETGTINAERNGGVSGSNTVAASKKNETTLNASLEAEAKIEDKAKAFVKGSGSVKGSAGASNTFGAECSDTVTDAYNRNYSVAAGQGKEDGTISHKGTNTTSNSSWNNESGYNGSSTVTTNTSLSKAISESISNKYGYGKSYIVNNEASSSQGITNSDTSSESFSSSVTYSKITAEEQTLSYTTSGSISGYHRWVMADTAHVFAVVGYDIATSSYFVNTYSVMEDNLKPYEDYSCSSANYDDNQNSFISFEVPYDIITEYVGNRVCASDGLEVNSAGIVTAYRGSDEYVVIPEYKVIDNQDGTKKVIHITGISENAFKGNKNITGVLMSTLIDDIPNGAFEGCTSLVEVQSCVSTIGERAFSGCTSMKAAMLGYGVKSIGDRAFDSVDDLTIYAINKSVVNAAVNSGAKNITIYVTDACESLDNTTLEVPKMTEIFTFNGYGKIYTDLRIISDADKTVINRATFDSTGRTPLQISSSNIELQEVTINAPAIGLICTSDTVNMSLYGESHVNSNNENAMLCKNISFSKIKDDYFSQIHVSGNVLVCGEIENESYLSIESGKIIYVDEEMFDKYKQGTINVTFNANGGSVSESTKTVYYGQLYGTLPTPSREYYSFLGWYTAAEGGSEITAQTPVTAVANQTLYAHWSRNTYKVNFNANGGSVSTSSKNVESGAKYGTLPTPTRTGWTFKGWYTATSGGSQITADSTVAITSEQTLYARWQVNSYTASWSTGTGYSITVKRTSSPNAGASIANISSGTTVYYGDVLSITYTASTGYSITGKGSTSITVSGNVTSSNIWVTASANNYTYTILYRSSNGTDLGSSSATYKFGTTNTISAPAKTGYNTPSSQSIKWDSTSKTITFSYSPITPATTQTIASGRWWTSSSGNTKLDYKVEAMWRNRTATSIEIKVRWTNTITNPYNEGRYGYKQEFEWWGWHTIATASAFSASGGTRSSSGESEWQKYTISPTDTTRTIGSEWKDNNGKSGSWSGTISIPAY